MTLKIKEEYDAENSSLRHRNNYILKNINSFPVAQMVEHGASNAKIMDSIPRESKSW